MDKKKSIRKYLTRLEMMLRGELLGFVGDPITKGQIECIEKSIRRALDHYCPHAYHVAVTADKNENTLKCIIVPEVIKLSVTIKPAKKGKKHKE